jgi:hypothetical protein
MHPTLPVEFPRTRATDLQGESTGALASYDAKRFLAWASPLISLLRGAPATWWRPSQHYQLTRHHRGHVLLDADRHRDAANRIGSTIFASGGGRSSIRKNHRSSAPNIAISAGNVRQSHGRNVSFRRIGYAAASAHGGDVPLADIGFGQSGYNWDCHDFEMNEGTLGNEIIGKDYNNWRG